MIASPRTGARRARRLALLLATLLSSPVLAQAPPDAGWDPAIRRGRLDNGLTWFVRRNATPERRAFARVVLLAGSLVEEDGERGLAHLCEHMAFNESKRFPPGELVRTLQAAGMRIGPHLDGATSRDRVTYRAELPVETPQDVERILDVNEAFAGGATLSDAEIDKERGVVLAELRRRRGVEAVTDALMRLRCGPSRHVDRDPGGSAEVVATATPDAIRAFYRRWYRPDLLGVVLVGDFDPDDAAARLTARLSTLPPAGPPADATFAVNTPEGVVARHVADPLLEEPRVVIDWLRIGQGQASDAGTGGERRWSVDDRLPGLAEEIAMAILDERLDRLARRTDAPFVSAGAGYAYPVRGLDATELQAHVRGGRFAEAVTVMASAAEAMATAGPCDAELSGELARRRAALDAEERQLGKLDSAAVADALEAAFRDDGIVIDPAEDIRIRRLALDRIDVARARDAFRARLGWERVAVLAFGPEAPATDDDGLVAAAAAGRAHPSADACASAGSAELVPTPPPPGRVVARERVEEIGADVLTLSNGMRVILKPQHARPDEVLLGGFVRAGLAGAPRHRLAAAALMWAVMSRSGTSDHPPEEIDSLLAGRRAQLGFGTDGLSVVARGGCGRADVETLLQLVHARLARPVVRPEAFLAVRELAIGATNAAQSDPRSALIFTAQRRVGRGELAGPDAAELAALSASDVIRAWTATTGDASAWTFVLVGDLDAAAATPAIERWLASLPARPGPAPTLPRPSALGKGRRALRLSGGVDDQCMSATLVGLRARGDSVDPAAIDDIRHVLKSRLNALLREELGAAYAVEVGVAELPPLLGYGALIVMFDCAASERPRLQRLVLDEVERIRREPPSEDEAAALREALRREWEASRESNDGWLDRIQQAAILGRDLRTTLDEPRRIEAVTPASLREVARSRIDTRRVLAVYTAAPGR